MKSMQVTEGKVAAGSSMHIWKHAYLLEWKCNIYISNMNFFAGVFCTSSEFVFVLLLLVVFELIWLIWPYAKWIVVLKYLTELVIIPTDEVMISISEKNSYVAYFYRSSS
jgi:hypothetical protein